MNRDTGWIDNLKNMQNMRDLGGKSGWFGTVRDGKLFRADGLYKANAEEVQMLYERNIRQIVDLRSEEENAEYSYRVDVDKRSGNPISLRKWKRQNRSHDSTDL